MKETRDFGLEDSTVPLAKIDYTMCKSCPNGAMGAPGHGSRPDRLAAACSRACVAKLEKSGKCSNKFSNQFRKREPWALDMFMRPVVAGGFENAANLGCGKRYDTGGGK